MNVSTSTIRQSEIAAEVETVARELAPDVVRVRHNIGSDWSGDPSIFFRIVLSDEASREERLAEVTRRIAAVLLERVNPSELGLLAYFNFRSQSEQATLKEKAWA